MAIGASIRVEVDDVAVDAALGRISAAGWNSRSLMASIGGHLLASTQRRFEATTAPGGDRWARLAPRTARERIKRGYGIDTILRRTGILYGSLTYVASGEAVEVGTNNPYAAAHQFGATIRRYARSQRIYQHYDPRTDTFDQRFRKASRSNFARWATIGEHTVTIPARPYLGIDAADRAAIVEIADAFLSRAIGGAS